MCYLNSTPKLLFHVSKWWRILKKNLISWILRCRRCLEESPNFVHWKTGTSAHPPRSSGLQRVTSRSNREYFHNSFLLLTNHFNHVDSPIISWLPLLPTNISESAGKSALHDLSTHQVIIFLQAGSRWQTWRQNSMEIWDSWCSLLYLALRIAFTWSRLGTRMTSTSNGRYTTRTNRRLGCFNRNIWTT